MPNVGAEFTASIVIDKNDLIAQALKQLSTAQKELEKNKLEIYFDLSNADLSKKLKEYQKQLSSTDYTIKINNNGIEETYKSLDKLLDIVKTIASGKDFGTGFGNINVDNAVKQIDKLENRISELTKKYEELQKKSSSTSGNISGKDVNLVDNEEFKKLSDSFEKIKSEVDDLKTHMSLLDDYTVDGDSFLKLGSQVDGLSAKLDDLLCKYVELSNSQKNIGAETNISLGDSTTASAIAEQNKLQEELRETREQAEQASNAVESVGNTSAIRNYWKKYGTSERDSYLTNKSNVTYDTIIRQLTEEENVSKGIMRQISKFIDPSNIMQGIDTDYFKAIDQELQKIGYHLDEIQINTNDHIASAKILPIDNHAITNAEEMERILKNIQSTSVSQDQMKDAIPDNQTNIKSEATAMEQVEKATDEAVQAKKDFATANDGVQDSVADSKSTLQLEAELMEQIAKSAREAADAKKEFVESNKLVEKSADDSNSGLKDGVEVKLDDATISAKELDKALDDVNIPTDDFDNILSKLNRTKSELTDIVKITKSWVSDSKGIGHEAYTLKDSRGSSEIYGISSKTEKGQILRQNIVQYDASSISKTKQEQDKLTEAMAKGREQSEKARQAEERRQELAQNNAINKALENEYKERQKLTEATEKEIQKNKELALSYTESASKKLSDAMSKYSYGDTSDAKSMMQQMNRGLSNFGDLSDVKGNIKTFDSVIQNIISDLKHSHEESLKSLNEEIKAESQLQSQKDSFYKSNLNAIDLEIKKREEEAKAFSNSLKAQMEAEQKAESQLQSYSNRLESYNKKTSGYDATIARFENGGWTSDEYIRNVNAVKEAVKKYQNILADLKTHPELVTEKDLNRLNKQEKLIKENINAVQNMSAAEKGFTKLSAQKELDKINNILKEHSGMSREAKNQIKAYYAQIKSGNPSASLDVIHAKIMEIVNAEVEAGRGGKSMWEAIKEKAWYGVASAIGTYFGFNDILRYGGDAINTIVQLDDALVDLKKTTAMSSSELENFYYDANDVAKQMGVTTEEIITQASAWSRLSYSSKEASTEMAKLSSQFASISPGMDTTTAQEDLVSIMRAYDIDPDEVKSQIMDKINVLGNNFAESNNDVAEGLKRSAAAMAAMNQSFEDTAALFTGGMEILQDAESMGTALRTMSMRIRGYDEETEQLSDDLVDVTGKVADLTKTTKNAQGISLFTDATQEHYKSMVQYLGEISDEWNDISEKNQTEFCLYVQKCA